jgi:predicted membrane protein
MDLVTLAAGAATLLSTWQLVPQVRRLRQVGSVDGLSIIWALVGICLNLGWIGYRWSQEIWLGLLSPIIAFVLYLVLFAMIVGARRENLLAITVSSSAFAAVVASAVLGGWVAVGVLLGAGSIVHIWPSVWAAFRSPAPLAVSPGTWAIGLSQAILWGLYGWGSHDSIHLIYGLATAPGAAAILGRSLFVRRRLKAAMLTAEASLAAA